MPKPNTAADEAPSLDELLELLQHSKSPLLDFNKQRIRNLFKQAITDAERRGRIAGLKSAHRYKGNPFEIGKKIIKEIERLEALQANAGGGERDE